jgi:general secretion pathway protein D
VTETNTSDSGPAIKQIGGVSGTESRRPAAYSPGTSEDGDGTTLNYADADVREIVRQILGDTLKVNYTIDAGFQGQATIKTVKPLKREELLPTLQTLLAQTGGTMTYQDGLFRIGPAGDASVIPPVVDAGTSGMGSQAVPLRFASAKQLVTVLQPFIGDGAKILADPARNVLVISGPQSARTSVADLIHVFDVDYLAGQSYALFQVKSGDPAKVATDLQKALQLEGDGPLSGAISVIPVEQANAIMIVARTAAYLERASRLAAQIDRMTDDGGRSIHIYYLKNVQALDLQPVLQRAVNPQSGGGSLTEPAPGNLPPTAEAAQVTTPNGSSGGTIGNGAMGSSLGQSGSLGQGAPGLSQASGSNSSAPLPPILPDVGQQSAGGAAQGPQIVADTKSNTLIVVSTDAEYEKIEAAIHRLDIMPMQVLIEATVAEVTLNDQLEYGTQFFLSHQGNSATLSNAVSPTPTPASTAGTPTNATLFNGTLAPSFPGFAIARAIGSTQVALEALKMVTNVRVISSPKLLVLDRQQARLEVGDLVPIITQTATSVVTSDSSIVNSVQYQPTGVILTVTPRVNSGGLVTLDIDQAVSQVVATTSSTINSPTFQQRKVTSKVAIHDGETISLAGLIQDTKTDGNSGIPYLNEIPVIGSLFSTKNKSTERTELLVLLTPRVVYDQHDVRALTEELRNKFPLASALRE